VHNAHLCNKNVILETKKRQTKVHNSLLLILAYALFFFSRLHLRLTRLFETCHIHTYIYIDIVWSTSRMSSISFLFLSLSFASLSLSLPHYLSLFHFGKQKEKNGNHQAQRQLHIVPLSLGHVPQRPLSVICMCPNSVAASVIDLRISLIITGIGYCITQTI